MAFKFLDASTSTGPSDSLPFRKINEVHGLQINITGAPTAVTVDIEGSLEGTIWNQVLTSPMTASELTAETSYTSIQGKPFRFIRLNLAVLTGGSTPTVTAFYEPLEHRD